MVGLSDRVAFALPPKTKEDNVVGLNIYICVCVRHTEGVGVTGMSEMPTRPLAKVRAKPPLDVLHAKPYHCKGGNDQGGVIFA